MVSWSRHRRGSTEALLLEAVQATGQPSTRDAARQRSTAVTAAVVHVSQDTVGVNTRTQMASQLG
jgi:hypothetical protein